MTSAPKSAMSVAATGPATQLAVSRTVMPSRRAISTNSSSALAVDLAQFAGGPLDRVLGLRALDTLGVHVHDHVLRIDLGRLGRWWARKADHARVIGGRFETLHGLVNGRPQRTLLPELGRPDGEALGDLEPLAVLLLAVHPLEEILRELGILRVLHHPVRERRVVTPRAGRAGGQPRMLDILHQRLAAV